MTARDDVPGGDAEPRELGVIRGERSGATLIVVAAIHGNEPAGLQASLRVLERLGARPGSIAGDLVVLAGNRRALARGQRFIRRDLNRGWTTAQLEALRARPSGTLADEDAEQLELDASIEAAVARARGPVHLADLHTSSAPGVPFALFGDPRASDGLIRACPMSVILGLMERVEGVLGEYWARRGVSTFAAEGGQHEDPESIENLEALLWVTLGEAGMVDAPEVEASRGLLDDRRAGLPRVIEVVSRHAITAEDAFVMEPGFRNIEPVEQGRLLARDRRGEIRAPEDGLVVLPLYQKLGNDGFFWARSSA